MSSVVAVRLFGYWQDEFVSQLVGLAAGSRGRAPVRRPVVERDPGYELVQLGLCAGSRR
jgi:hypothetical protein